MSKIDVRTTTPEIALVGNPNAGKTTIFNGLTGNSQRVGNWPGVTVERSEGVIRYRGRNVRVIDLPGIYSINAATEDERVARDYILSGSAQVLVNVVDATNLERNLYLTSQLIEMNVPVIVVLTMADRAKRDGISIDVSRLAVHLGVPVIMVNSLDSVDIGHLRDELALHAGGTGISSAVIRYADAIERLVESWEHRFAILSEAHGVDARWIAIQFLEGDEQVRRWVFESASMPEEQWDETRRHLVAELNEDPDIVIADGRFGFVHGITRDIVSRRLDRESLTERLDRLFLNRFVGVPLFLGIMFFVFWSTIAVGGAFIDFFDIISSVVFVDGTRSLLSAVSAPQWLAFILADGVGAGLQTVATFIPIIFMMFLMLSVMENSGYMARAAFVMDRFMRSLGLSGKSFVPLIVGFGCTVPAISATRTLESRKERMMTTFMAPLMSCGARLPVYALFSAAFFPGRAGVVVFSLYLMGIVLAVATGLLLKRFVFPGEGSHLVMELPPYHIPRISNILRYSWNRLRLFIVGAGATITVAVMILSVLNTVSLPGREDESVLQRVGKSITPLFSPLGIEEENWPATVGLFTGLFAKEAIVGTLNSLYGIEADGDAEEVVDAGPWRFLAARRSRDAFQSLADSFSGLGIGVSADPVSGRLDLLRSRFSPAGAYAYLVFVLIYIPCLAAMGAAVTELGLLYGSILAVYLTTTAWALSTLVYQVLAGPRLAPVAVAIVLLAVAILAVAAMGYREGRLYNDRA